MGIWCFSCQTGKNSYCSYFEKANRLLLLRNDYRFWAWAHFLLRASQRLGADTLLIYSLLAAGSEVGNSIRNCYAPTNVQWIRKKPKSRGGVGISTDSIVRFATWIECCPHVHFFQQANRWSVPFYGASLGIEASWKTGNEMLVAKIVPCVL